MSIFYTDYAFILIFQVVSHKYSCTELEIADLHWAREQEALKLDEFLIQQNSKRELCVWGHPL